MASGPLTYVTMVGVHPVILYKAWHGRAWLLRSLVGCGEMIILIPGHTCPEKCERWLCARAGYWGLCIRIFADAKELIVIGPTPRVVREGILTVFSPEKFQGNPLALVSVHGNVLSQRRKAQLAREFKYSETVFLHDAPGPGQPRLLEIFTETGEELPFAGHPIIGTAHYIFTYLEKINYDVATRDTQKQTTTLLTKAGRIPIFFNPYRQVAACVVPTSFHVHAKRVDIEKIISTQPHVQIVPTIDKERGRTFPLVSIVKGMTFVLVDLTDNPEIFGALQAGKSPEAELDADWAPSFVGCMYYRVLAKSEVPGEPAIHNVQARMISHGIEDPGTGSACSALSCYLALQSQGQEAASEQKANPAEGSTEPAAASEEGKPPAANADLVKKTEDLKVGDAKIERKVFGIQQGAEMGRLCTIAVEVDVKTDADGEKSIANVILSGRANMMLKGEVLGF
ncbi:hypothetical protein A1O7_05365 [Cladophialophora yegresii CBS 114405]|uniref:Phenazine biosynthesis protein n=1 Tax=Cladophialophora yegresii CBS 114405 TaxID=1182544 RepID=W9VQF3_9EURO|nr:uncharacterized protein A1O7_05365 [Cladophialophora yegresii CBS 114405]EXJ57942.1 hypothetical protein A1O7_05365 [Cladophialophora yegresii CBS 114405]